MLVVDEIRSRPESLKKGRTKRVCIEVIEASRRVNGEGCAYLLTAHEEKEKNKICALVFFSLLLEKMFPLLVGLRGERKQKPLNEKHVTFIEVMD